MFTGIVEELGRVVELEGPRLRVRCRTAAQDSPVGASVAVNGVSLTVAAVEGATFSVALIPHTLAVTTLGTAGAGDPVNLEVDVLAKYVERLLGPLANRERER